MFVCSRAKILNSTLGASLTVCVWTCSWAPMWSVVEYVVQLYGHDDTTYVCACVCVPVCVCVCVCVCDVLMLLPVLVHHNVMVCTHTQSETRNIGPGKYELKSFLSKWSGGSHFTATSQFCMHMHIDTQLSVFLSMYL